jgi:hypothetical protein
LVAEVAASGPASSLSLTQLTYGVIGVACVSAVNLLVVVGMVLRSRRNRSSSATPASNGHSNPSFRANSIRSFDSIASKFSAGSFDGDNYLSRVAES